MFQTTHQPYFFCPHFCTSWLRNLGPFPKWAPALPAVTFRLLFAAATDTSSAKTKRHPVEIQYSKEADKITTHVIVPMQIITILMDYVCQPEK